MRLIKVADVLITRRPGRTGGEHSALAVECDSVNALKMALVPPQNPARGHIPQVHEALTAARREAAVVVRSDNDLERESARRAVSVDIHLYVFSVVAISVHGDGGDLAAVSSVRLDLPTTVRVPELDELVVARREAVLSIIYSPLQKCTISSRHETPCNPNGAVGGRAVRLKRTARTAPT